MNLVNPLPRTEAEWLALMVEAERVAYRRGAWFGALFCLSALAVSRLVEGLIR